MQQVHQYLTTAEAAEVLRLSSRTLERFRLEGGGPRWRRAGRRVLYARADLDAWIEPTFSTTSESAA
jgi:excisionase family DNA binding protein